MAETPQSMTLDLDRSNLTIKQRCGNCKHLRRIAHPAYEKPCINLGMLELSKPCARFSVDPTKLKFSKDRHARNAVDFMRDLSDDKLKLYASQILEECRTRRYGFTFGETVYLKAFGGDYLSNYRRVKVVSADKTYVNVVGSDGFTAMIYHKSVISAKAWTKKRKQLIEDEKLTDPAYKKYTESKSHAEMQLTHVRDTLTAQEFDSTNRHEFALTIGKTKSINRFDRARATPITMLIRTR